MQLAKPRPPDRAASQLQAMDMGRKCHLQKPCFWGVWPGPRVLLCCACSQLGHRVQSPLPPPEKQVCGAQGPAGPSGCFVLSHPSVDTRNISHPPAPRATLGLNCPRVTQSPEVWAVAEGHTFCVPLRASLTSQPKDTGEPWASPHPAHLPVATNTLVLKEQIRTLAATQVWGRGSFWHPSDLQSPSPWLPTVSFPQGPAQGTWALLLPLPPTHPEPTATTR